MATLLMFVALPQNMAVPAKFCYLSRRGMFIGNVGIKKNRKHRARSLGKEIMFGFILLAAGLLLPTVHLLVWTKDRSVGNIARLYLAYLLPISVGIGGVLAFMGHTFRAEEVAKSIGWPTGNPFQFEVAVANLAFGVLGLLCLKFQNGFWAATVLGYGVFLEGAAYGHIREIVQAGNWSINNAGPVLFADVFFPIFLMILLLLSKLQQRKSTEHNKNASASVSA
jgi:hypothetical protein